MLGQTLLVAAVSLMGARFDGTNPVTIPHAAALNIGGEYAIRACVRARTLGAVGRRIDVLNRSEAVGLLGYTSEYELTLSGLSDGTWTLATGSSDGEIPTFAGGNVTLIPGRWYDVAGTYDGTTAKVYIAARRYKHFDADPSYTLVASEDIPAGLTLTVPNRIGATCNATTSPFDLDELRASDAAMDLAALNAERWFRLTAGEAAAQVAYYACDDFGDELPTLHDVSGYGHDGTFSGIPAWTDDPQDLYYPDWYRSSTLPDARGIIALPAAPSVGGSMTASDEDADWPATALSSPQRGRVTRTEDATGEKTWDWDLGVRQAIGAILIPEHNFSSTAAIEVDFADDAAYTSPVTVALRYHARSIWQLLDRPMSYRFWRLRVTDEDNPDGYLELAAFWPAIVQEVLAFPSLDAVAEPEGDLSVAVETQAGDRVARDMPRTQAVSVSWSGLRNGHARHLHEVLAEAAGGRAIWLAPEAAMRRYVGTVYGYVTKTPTLTQGTDPSGTYMQLDGLEVEADTPLR